MEHEKPLEVLLRNVARTPAVFAPQRRIAPGTRLAARFDIELELGRGGMGRVYRALDTLRRTHVALKTLGCPAPRAVSMLHQEFRAVSQLVHPNLVRLYGFWREGLECFIAMQLLEGCRFQWTPCFDARQIAKIFQQLAAGVAYLHQNDVVHGDIKPSNFIVTRAGRVVILDFGLSRPLRSLPERGCWGGTVGFMAPELALGQEADAASDWFAFGKVLCQALTGSMDAAALSQVPVHATIAGELVSLCKRLLTEDPAGRPRAREILSQLQVATLTQHRSSCPLPVATKLIGRERELSALAAALRESEYVHCPVFQVTGASGVGKSALLDEFELRARGNRAMVLRSRCHEGETILYKSIDGLMESLVCCLEQFGEAHLDRVLPDGVAHLVRLFPMLNELRPIERRCAGCSFSAGKPIERRQAIRAFVDLVQAIRREGPLVMILDELQWSDRESAAMLEQLIADTNSRAVLLILAHRADFGSEAPLVEALLSSNKLFRSDGSLPQLRRIELESLAFDQAVELALTHLPRQAKGRRCRAHTIAREAVGNPLLVAEMACDASAQTLQALVAHKVTHLDESDHRVLQLAACGVVPIALSIIHQAAKLTRDSAEDSVKKLCAVRLLCLAEFDGEISVHVHHHRVRETVYGSLSPVERQSCHTALAAAFSAQVKAELGRGAGPYSGSEQPPLTGVVKRRWRAFAFARAAEHFDLAARGEQCGSYDRLRPKLRRTLPSTRAQLTG